MKSNSIIADAHRMSGLPSPASILFLNGTATHSRAAYITPNDLGHADLSQIRRYRLTSASDEALIETRKRDLLRTRRCKETSPTRIRERN